MRIRVCVCMFFNLGRARDAEIGRESWTETEIDGEKDGKRKRDEAYACACTACLTTLAGNDRNLFARSRIICKRFFACIIIYISPSSFSRILYSRVRVAPDLAPRPSARPLRVHSKLPNARVIRGRDARQSIFWFKLGFPRLDAFSGFWIVVSANVCRWSLGGFYCVSHFSSLFFSRNSHQIMTFNVGRIFSTHRIAAL